MPIYDCGNPDCDECKREFGPDRTEAVTNYFRRYWCYTPHTHVAGTTHGLDIDTCARCGHDIRHNIHARQR